MKIKKKLIVINLTWNYLSKKFVKNKNELIEINLNKEFEKNKIFNIMIK